MFHSQWDPLRDPRKGFLESQPDLCQQQRSQDRKRYTRKQKNRHGYKEFDRLHEVSGREPGHASQHALDRHVAESSTLLDDRTNGSRDQSADVGRIGRVRTCRDIEGDST